jgi:SAM-dependent methyltransferase
MQNLSTSLPSRIDKSIRNGTRLVGDDFDDARLALWFEQERDAFYEGDAGSGEIDPWYAYMRYVNEVLGFTAVAREPRPPESMLVLGPGSGIEVVEFACRHPRCQLNFLEASSKFQQELQTRFPGSHIILPRHTGEIDLPDASQDVVCAFSVLHHIPNVSKVLSEAARVTRPGGLLMVREPCSSMGDWRRPRSATPNERGISLQLMLQFAERAGLRLERVPTPILLEPINKFLKITFGFGLVPFPVLYAVDRSVSKVLALNDHYWRDSLPKKVGPSSYFYLFRRMTPES